MCDRAITHASVAEDRSVQKPLPNQWSATGATARPSPCAKPFPRTRPELDPSTTRCSWRVLFRRLQERRQGGEGKKLKTAQNSRKSVNCVAVERGVIPELGLRASRGGASLIGREPLSLSMV